MKRIETIQKIMHDVINESMIASCGMISREVYFVRNRPNNFYVMGSMGAAVGLGIGLALTEWLVSGEPTITTPLIILGVYFAVMWN